MSVLVRRCQKHCRRSSQTAIRPSSSTAVRPRSRASISARCYIYCYTAAHLHPRTSSTTCLTDPGQGCEVLRFRRRPGGLRVRDRGATRTRAPGQGDDQSESFANDSLDPDERYLFRQLPSTPCGCGRGHFGQVARSVWPSVPRWTASYRSAEVQGRVPSDAVKRSTDLSGLNSSERWRARRSTTSNATTATGMCAPTRGSAPMPTQLGRAQAVLRSRIPGRLWARSASRGVALAQLLHVRFKEHRPSR